MNNISVSIKVSKFLKTLQSKVNKFRHKNVKTCEENVSPIPSPVSSYEGDIHNSFKSQLMNERAFLNEVKACMYDTSRLQSFMEEAEYHPVYGWHKMLLFFNEIQSSSRTTPCSIDPMIINKFIEELVTKFPDILQRVLLRGAYEQNYKRLFGAVHIAVICRQTKIVELLTKIESKTNIKQCLIGYMKDCQDEFKAIERVLLWSNLKKSTEDALHSYSLAKFINEFKKAIKSANEELLQTLIAHAHLYPKDAWRTILLWASACGQHHIVRRFKEEQSELFTNIRENSEIEGFSTLRTTSIKEKELLTKGKQEICDLLSDLADLADGPCYRELLAQNLHSRMGQGWTPLHIATILQDDSMLNTLLDCYSAHHTWDKTADKLDSYKFDSVLKEHHKKQYNINYSYHDFSDDSWMTPLHYAIIGEDEKIVKKLLRWETFKFHLNDFNLFMCTSFHMAASSQSGSHMLDLLMENPSIDVNVVDCCLFSPLHWAVHVGATDPIRFLLSRAFNPERPIKMSEEDVDRRPPFAIAVENETWKLLTSLPEVKQEVERLYRDRQVYVDAANAILVGAALIAGVTFGGWLSPTEGTRDDYHYVQTYWVFNSLSFFFSTASVIAGAATVLPMEDVYIGKAVKVIREWLILTSFLLIISVIFVLGAFTAAGFISLDLSVPKLRANMIVTTVIGCLMCGFIGVKFLIKICALSGQWTYKYSLIVVRFTSRIYRCIQIAIGHPLNPITSGIELDVTEDWHVIGRKWKRREKDWRRYRGIHQLGEISTCSCRKYAIDNVKSSQNRLLAECRRLQEVGKSMAKIYEDIGWEYWTDDTNGNQFQFGRLQIIDEHS